MQEVTAPVVSVCLVLSVAAALLFWRLKLVRADSYQDHSIGRRWWEAILVLSPPLFSWVASVLPDGVHAIGLFQGQGVAVEVGFVDLLMRGAQGLLYPAFLVVSVGLFLRRPVAVRYAADFARLCGVLQILLVVLTGVSLVVVLGGGNGVEKWKAGGSLIENSAVLFSCLWLRRLARTAQ